MRNQQMTPHGLGNIRSLLGLVLIFVFWQYSPAIHASHAPCTTQNKADCYPNDFKEEIHFDCKRYVCMQGLGEVCNGDTLTCKNGLTCTKSECWGCFNGTCYPDRRDNVPVKRIPNWLQRVRFEKFAHKYIEPYYD